MNFARYLLKYYNPGQLFTHIELMNLFIQSHKNVLILLHGCRSNENNILWGAFEIIQFWHKLTSNLNEIESYTSSQINLPSVLVKMKIVSLVLFELQAFKVMCDADTQTSY